MTWDATEPNRNQFSYGNGDRIASQARGQGAILRGHALLWHQQQPSSIPPSVLRDSRRFWNETVLEREFRPAGRVRAGPEAGKAGGVADEPGGGAPILEYMNAGLVDGGGVAGRTGLCRAVPR